MKHIALALIACAGLGYVAGGHNPVVVPDNHKPSMAAPVTDETPAIQTPLVEKLLPKPVQSPEKRTTISDCQLSPRGNFRYDPARNIWVPVDKGNRRYTHNGGPVTAAHLVAEHGHHPSSAYKWTRGELEIAHANDHAAEVAVKRAAPVYQSSCPNGQCGNPGYGRGVFGRRR